MPTYPPTKTTGTLLALAAVEHILRGDQQSIGDVLAVAEEHELKFGMAFLAGQLAAYLRHQHGDDVLDELARWRQQLLAADD